MGNTPQLILGVELSKNSRINDRMRLILIALLSLLIPSALFGEGTKIYLLGENHDDLLAKSIHTRLDTECFEKKIYYVHEGVMRYDLDEYSIIGGKDIDPAVRQDNYCMGMEEPISYHLAIATAGYALTFSDDPDVISFWITTVLSRFRSKSINGIFKYLRKNGSEDTKRILGNINDELLNMNYRGIRDGGYRHIKENLSVALVKSLGTKEEWLAFFRDFSEILWTHGEDLSGFSDIVGIDFLEDLFSRESSEAMSFFMELRWMEVALKLRDVYMANNIYKGYLEAKEKGVNLAASIGAKHIEGISKLLKSTGIPKEDIVIIDTNDKEQIAAIVLQEVGVEIPNAEMCPLGVSPLYVDVESFGGIIILGENETETEEIDSNSTSTEPENNDEGSKPEEETEEEETDNDEFGGEVHPEEENSGEEINTEGFEANSTLTDPENNDEGGKTEGETEEEKAESDESETEVSSEENNE